MMTARFSCVYFSLVLIHSVCPCTILCSRSPNQALEARGAAKTALVMCGSLCAHVCGPCDKCECMPRHHVNRRGRGSEWLCAVSDRSSDLCLPHTSSLTCHRIYAHFLGVACACCRKMATMSCLLCTKAAHSLVVI